MRGSDRDLTSTERERERERERESEVSEDKTLRTEKIKVFDSKLCGVLDLWGEIKKKKIIKEGYTCVAGSAMVGKWIGQNNW